MRENKGNYFSGKHKQNHPSSMLQGKEIHLLTKWREYCSEVLVEVRTRTLSVTGSVLVFTKYTAQPEAHTPVYVHMHLYREHINILGGGHTKDGRSIFGMLWEGHTPRPSTGWVSFGTLNVAPLMIDTKEFPEIKTTRAYFMHEGTIVGPSGFPPCNTDARLAHEGQGVSAPLSPVSSMRLPLSAGVWPRNPSACCQGRSDITRPFILVHVGFTVPHVYAPDAVFL